MSSRRVVALLLTSGAALAMLAGLLTGLLSGSTPALAGAATSTSSSSPPAVDHIVVIGVPGFVWSDVSPATTPSLARLVGTSAVGAMTVRADVSITRRVEGWLTFGSGSRAEARLAPAATLPANYLPDITDPAVRAALVHRNAKSRFEAHLFLLGDALRAGGIRVAAVGDPGAALGAADGSGPAREAPSIRAALATARVVVVETTAVYAAPIGSPIRAAGLASVDALVRRTAGLLGPRDVLLVAGVSDRAGSGPELTVALAHGPTYDRRWLMSGSGARTPYVQLIDIAPTILHLLGLATPSAMIGHPWEAAGPGLPAAAATVPHRLAVLDRRARVQRRGAPYVRDLAVVLVGAFAFFTALSWVLGRRSRWLHRVAPFVAAVPIGTWLGQAFPWWRWPAWSVLPIASGFALLIAALAVLGPWRRNPWGPVAVVAGISATVLTVDGFRGGAIELFAPFGDSPLIGARFHGIGNLAFAVLSAASLIAGTALLARRRSPRAAIGIAAVGVVVCIADAAPMFGDDLGGVLTLVPSFGVLALLVAGRRFRPRFVVGLVVAAVAVAAAAVGIDALRPSAQQSHVGRFAGQLGNGTAGPLVHRKLLAAVHTATAGYYRWGVLIAVLAALVGVWLWRQGRLRATAGVDPAVLGALVLAVALDAVLGSALNDSGLAVAAMVSCVAFPLLSRLVVPEPVDSPSVTTPASAASSTALG